MKNQEIRIIWSHQAKSDLKFIFDTIKSHTKSENYARNVVGDILMKVEEIKYINQYQVDEYLGAPYRRMVVRNYKIIYKGADLNAIRILKIFNTYQHPTSRGD